MIEVPLYEKETRDERFPGRDYMQKAMRVFNTQQPLYRFQPRGAVPKIRGRHGHADNEPCQPTGVPRSEIAPP